MQIIKFIKYSTFRLNIRKFHLFEIKEKTSFIDISTPAQKNLDGSSDVQGTPKIRIS